MYYSSTNVVVNASLHTAVMDDTKAVFKDFINETIRRANNANDVLDTRLPEEYM